MVDPEVRQQIEAVLKMREEAIKQESGNEMCAISEGSWGLSKGYYVRIYVWDADSWKIRVEYVIFGRHCFLVARLRYWQFHVLDVVGGEKLITYQAEENVHSFQLGPNLFVPTVLSFKFKDFCYRRLDTVLGTVRLRVPRYRHCQCQSGTQVWSPLLEVFSGE
jgi:hypothetical protein